MPQPPGTVVEAGSSTANQRYGGPMEYGREAEGAVSWPRSSHRGLAETRTGKLNRPPHTRRVFQDDHHNATRRPTGHHGKPSRPRETVQELKAH